MKKWLIILIVLLFTNVNDGYSQFRAYRLPEKNKQWSILLFEKFETKIEVQGLFYETTIQMKVRLGRRYYRNQCEQADPGSYQYEWIFQLPEEAFVTGFQLWNATKNSFENASLVDITSAEAVFAPTSTVTPQVLLREYKSRKYDGRWDHFYHLKISPVDRDQSVEFKIQYLLPSQMYWDVRRIAIHSRQFYNPAQLNCNNHASAEFNVLDHDHPDDSPREIHNMNLS